MEFATYDEIQIGFGNLLYTVQAEDAVWLYENMSTMTEPEFIRVARDYAGGYAVLDSRSGSVAHSAFA